VLAAEHVPATSTTVMDGPSPTPTTTNQDQGEAVVEGEIASRREPPRRVQVDVANMASYAISFCLLLVIHDIMIIGTNHIVLACLCRHF
jgi:hypothetical protein